MNEQNHQASGSVAEVLEHARKLLQTNPGAAARQARAIIGVEPGIAEAHLILANALRATGDQSGADQAELDALRVSTADPTLRQVARLLDDGRDEESEALLRRFMEDTPADPEALRLLAAMATKANQLDRSEQLLRKALRLVPGFQTARRDLDAVIELQSLAYASTPGKPGNPPEGLEEFEEAIRLNEKHVAENPEDPKAWLSYGHVLRMAGNQSKSVEAYRKALALDPAFGEAWWSLADLKTVALDEADREALAAQLECGELADAERIAMHFALGKAFGDISAFEQSFCHYEAGNEIRAKSGFLRIAAVEDHVQEAETRFTTEYFASRAGAGHPAADPIFVIGMHRSGSTLVEQILSSHSAIEGTEELVYLGDLASLLADGRRAGVEPSNYLENLAGSDEARLETIGGSYLWKADNHRRSSRPYFIDKMPRNWRHLPLIRLALPNAKIIDVRRDPLDCCWSNFRQLFGSGGEFTYKLDDIGRYYRAYARMTDHFDKVAPGAIHRVFYEQLVADPEVEVRRLLDYLGLEFEPAMMQFHKNPRAVKTSSSEQVRQPISEVGLNQARSYDQWLGPLKEALGSVLDAYPGVPRSWS